MEVSSTRSIDTLGVIGDVHAEDRQLERCLDFLAEQGVERVLCTGDIVDGPGSVDRCCALLQERGVTTVRGNHERWFLADQLRDLPDATLPPQVSAPSRTFLAGLPRTVELQLAAGPLLLCHGLGDDDMAGLWPHDEGYAVEANLALQDLVLAGRHRLVVAGHTHRRMLRTVGRLTFINAGTIMRDHEPCLLVADFARGVVQYFDLAPEGRPERAELLSLELRPERGS